MKRVVPILIVLLIALGGIFFFSDSGKKLTDRTGEIVTSDDGGGILDRLHLYLLPHSEPVSTREVRS